MIQVRPFKGGGPRSGGGLPCSKQLVRCNPPPALPVPLPSKGGHGFEQLCWIPASVEGTVTWLVLGKASIDASSLAVGAEDSHKWSFDVLREEEFFCPLPIVSKERPSKQSAKQRVRALARYESLMPLGCLAAFEMLD